MSWRFKTAMAFSGRKKIMVFEGGFHGGVLAFAGGKPLSTTAPYEFVFSPYNDTESARRIIRERADELAAVVVEPMLGAGGCIPGDPEFLRTIVAEARECGVLSIFDEVQTSRLSIGDRQKLLGLKPDLTTIGKYFGGGTPFGAFGGRADIVALYDPRRPDHLDNFGTFNNNILSMSAGYAGLLQVLTETALDELNKRGDNLRHRLVSLFKETNVQLSVTDLGSIMNLSVIGSPEFVIEVKQLLFFELLDRGYYCAPRGLVSLSLAITDDDTKVFFLAVESVIKKHWHLLN